MNDCTCSDPRLMHACPIHSPAARKEGAHTIEAVIEAKDPSHGWQDVDIILPGIGKLVITRQANGLTLWGIDWTEDAHTTLSAMLEAPEGSAVDNPTVPTA